MKKTISFFVFLTFTTLVGALLATTVALYQLDEQQQLLHDTPLERVELEGIQSLIKSEGLSNDKTKLIIDRFRSEIELRTSLKGFCSEYALAVKKPLKIAQLLLVVTSIIILLGAIVAGVARREIEKSD